MSKKLTKCAKSYQSVQKADKVFNKLKKSVGNVDISWESVQKVVKVAMNSRSVQNVVKNEQEQKKLRMCANATKLSLIWINE